MPANENRRRTKRKVVTTGQDHVSKEADTSDPQRRRRRRKRKVGFFLGDLLRGSRRGFGKIRNLPIVSLVTFLAIFSTFFVFRWFFRPSSEPTLIGASRTFQQRYYQSREVVKGNQHLYDSVYKLRTERLLPPDQTAWPEYERRPYELKSTYGSGVEACDVTILFTDPRLGFPKYDYGPGQSMWFALESIGAFAPEACVLLQTSTCAMMQYLDEGVPNEEAAMAEVVNTVYDNSLPLFRRMIEAGLVRITFIDHAKYNLKSCKDYGNPTAYLNRWFWEDEFLKDVDSDLVLLFQEDAALCYPLDIKGLTGYAFIGGVWPNKATPLIPDPMEGPCLGMPARWKNWLLPQRRWKTQQENPDMAAKHPALKPKEILPEIFPPVCEGGRGPLGSGGFSLRSRKWMIRAIETCPHMTNSGMEVEGQPLSCKVFEKVNEDFYFGTILRALGAPLPLAYTASLFSTEMLWPEQAWDLYGLPDDLTRNLRGDVITGKPFIWMDGKRLTIPNGVHKPWWYHPNEILRSDAMTNACPFLQYIFTPQMSRWEEVTKHVTRWVGIGK